MKRTLLLALAAILAFSCEEKQPIPDPEPTPTPTPQPGPDKPLAGEYVLPLVETTDTHGYIVNNDNGTIHYRLAYIADKINDIRGHGAECDRDRLLLLDGGDIYQGASVSNLQGGVPLFVAYDRMGYDAVAVGNHEFDWGITTVIDADATLPDYQWEGTACASEVPVLCSNLYQNGSRVPFTKDYAIIRKTAMNSEGEKVEVKIGVIGFAPNYASSIMTTKFTGAGYSLREDYSIPRNIAAELESTGQCDATILLTHDSADDAADNLGSNSVIDLVLGGHSHRTMSGSTSWGLPYLQGGRYAEHFGYAELRFSVDTTGAVSFLSVGKMRTETVNSDRDVCSRAGQNASDLDEDILAVSKRAVEISAAQLEDVIGYIDVGATSYRLAGSGERCSAIGNWMCDIMRRIGEADVSFVNGGGIRTSFPLYGSSRDITVANVYEMFPFSNAIYVYKLTYADLLKVFEYSLTSGGKSLFTGMTGLDCHFYSDGEIHSLRLWDGTVIYSGGKWTGDWASRTVILAVSEFLATSERTDYSTGTPNPLVEWNSTSRLLYNNLVDNENAVLVLREEAAASGGLLKVDDTAHFIVMD
ncbi:MAG: 5'-nucleotidase C-terminal domain-containing protein [Bacteroidales bacterium]|nr:5'-nucleotidase C-terminal domain-containing protein [Bacteroidales bacterium]